jgi:hypothetical protein
LRKLVRCLRRIFQKGFSFILKRFVLIDLGFRAIVYAITNYDIQTNEIITVHHHHHGLGLNVDLLKVKSSG